MADRIGKWVVATIVFGVSCAYGAMPDAPPDGAGPGRSDRVGEAKRRAGLFVGRWTPEGAGDGQVQTVRADGTGTNVDGSGFLWRFEGRHLAVRRAGAGEESDLLLTVNFTKDGNAYRLTIEHGNRQAVFRRLGEEGEKRAHSGASGGEYDPVPPAPQLPADGAKVAVGRLAVRVDASAALELEDWAGQAGRRLEAWYPKIVGALAVDGTPPERVVHLVLRGGEVPPGETAGSRIMISSKWAADHRDQSSVVAHEMVHVLQRYGTGAPAWLVEGIPDYVRFYVIDRGARGAEFRADISNFDNGYVPTAGMLDWLERRRPGTVARLDLCLREGIWGPETFEEVTGFKPADAWRRYLDSRKE